MHGGKAVRYRGNVAFVLGIGFTLFTLIGCGSKQPGDNPPTASIAASNAAGPTDASPGKNAPKSDPRRPVVAIDTSLGQIVVRLDGEKSPITVANFLSYVGAGHYDQTVFHQVLKDYAVLAGTFTTDLVEKKTFTPIRNEAHNGLKNRRGTIAMARQAGVIDSATSQFFINVADNPSLDQKDRTVEGYGYCVFGEVTAGMNVVDKIAALPVEDKDRFQRMPVEQVVIRSIRRVQ